MNKNIKYGLGLLIVGFVLTTDGSITVGTTSLSFSQFSGAVQITAGSGLTKSANTLYVNDYGILSNRTYSKIVNNNVTGLCIHDKCDVD